jgi:hypothetical protein
MILNGCPDLPLEPPVDATKIYICPVCEEDIMGSARLYKSHGKVIGCEMCVEITTAIEESEDYCD